MLSFDPSEISMAKLHGYLLSGIEPRPIAFTSTVDKKGIPYLSTFSSFNVFSINPPVLILTLVKRSKGSMYKQVIENIKLTKEVVINVINYDIVHQMSLYESKNEKGINKFEKVGLRTISSEKIKPLRLAESPIQLECKINDIIEFKEGVVAENLIICEVLKLHIKEELLDENKNIDQNKLELIAHAGNSLKTETKVSDFDLSKLDALEGIGIGSIPEEIKNSDVLTGKNLAMLGKIISIPSDDDVDKFTKDHTEFIGLNKLKKHTFAKEFLEKKDVISAWKVLLMK